MNEHVKKFLNTRLIYCIHVIVYVVFVLLNCYTVLDVRVQNSDFSVFTSFYFIAVLILLFLIETLFFKREKGHINRQIHWTWFRLFQMFIFAMFGFCMPEQIGQGACFVALLMFTFETVFFFQFDDKIRRISVYIVCGLAFESFVIWRAMQSNTSFQAINFFVVTGVVVLAAILICETISGMYNYFVKLVFAQNRTVENLNEANEQLQEKQEQIKKTNELLGLQKIELQAANKKINRSHDEMSVQNEVAGLITSTVNLDELLYGVCRMIRVRLDLDFVCVVIEPELSYQEFEKVDSERGVFISTTMGDSYMEQVEQRIMSGEVNELLELSHTYIQNEETDHFQLNFDEDDSKKLQSIVIVPMKKQGKIIGNLIVGKRSINAFMDNKTFYQNIGNQLNMGITNIRMYEQMEQMAIRDGLTHIYNRRHLTKLINEYLIEAMENRTSVAIALFDIDKFKQVNDTYGHLCGDAVICHVASLLKQAASENGGIAGRYGGEEFVIAFHEKSLSEVNDIVTKVHQRVRDGEVTFEDKVIRIRVSAGIAAYPETCKNPAELVSRADWAMYHSKRTGRDRITIDSDEIDTSM